jgi:light-regulated signal transduction histidine kinase (bacteriophytochrome)
MFKKYLEKACTKRAKNSLRVNKENRNNLKSTWINMKKTFDLVSHKYLMICLEKLNLSQWITNSSQP